MCWCVVAILLLNVMDGFSVCGGALLDRPCMVFQRVLLPYVLYEEFEGWITGVCSPYVISLSGVAYYVFGQEPAVAMHLSLWYVLLACHQYDVCENSVGSVYVGGYGGLSESGLCVFCKLCSVCFLVVGKVPSVCCSL